MRIVKDGPYGKSIYIDTGYVESGASQTTAPIVSNHIFVGNTRVASVVKHTEEKQPATYFYASDHLGSSSVLTTQQGSYHERIEYLPYGETWVEDKATSDGYSTPYKFTGKELDAETGLYYFGARYYDARMSRWVSADPALEKYIPKPNDFDTEHDFYWYIFNDASGKLPGMGGVFNSGNMNLYHYALNNPIKITDPDGKAAFFWHFMLTYSVARNLGIGFVDSIKLAWNAMIWDFRKGSQSKTDEAMINSHAMKSENQSIGEGRQGADAFITKKLNTAELKVMMDEDLRSNSKDTRLGKIHSALQDVGEATHCAVDKATNTHRDKKWSKDLTFNDKMKHFWGDIFLSDKELSDAKQNVKDVLTRALDMGVLRRNDEN